jgi:transposase
VTSVAIWAGLGDVRRFGNSDDVVRHAGLDITVYSSDGKRSAGHLSRRGPQLLRWALYEAAKCAARDGRGSVSSPWSSQPHTDFPTMSVLGLASPRSATEVSPARYRRSC